MTLCDDLCLIRSVTQNIRAGLAIVDLGQKILWCNECFEQCCATGQSIIGKLFFHTLGRPQLLGPDFYPFTKVKSTGQNSSTLLLLQSSTELTAPRYFDMNTAPVFDSEGKVYRFVVRLIDVSDEETLKVKWDKIRSAGKELTDISKKDVLSRSPTERVNILKAKIAHSVQDILKFSVIEIRVVSHHSVAIANATDSFSAGGLLEGTKRLKLLEPLLAIEMGEEAAHRTLYVDQDNNGITGWVAYHHRSYRMDDANEDPLYIEGIEGAKSSLTVPLLYQGNLVGTFNVESKESKAFDDNDLKLLEYFATAVAQAIHTLELFDVEYADTAFRSIENVYNIISPPVNQILLDTARLRAGNLGDRNDIYNTLAMIQESARKVQEAFRGSVADLTQELPLEISATDCIKYPMLRDKRILMTDSDETTGFELRRLLFYYGCTVDTATNGENALKMLENASYDAYMSDIKLPDMSAFNFFKTVRCIHCRKVNNMGADIVCEPPDEAPCCPRPEVPYIPFIYMRAFGYDSAHVMTRAAQAGVVKPIFKPFVLSQLLDTLKFVIVKSGSG